MQTASSSPFGSHRDVRRLIEIRFDDKSRLQQTSCQADHGALSNGTGLRGSPFFKLHWHFLLR